MEIPITFLGTGQAIPTAQRNHSGILLRYKDEAILVDCGEGIQRQFRKAKLNPCKLTKILITHMHGDHILGLPGLFQTLALNGYNKVLEVYVPEGTSQYIEKIFNIFVFIGKLKYDVKEVSGKFFENEDFILEAKELEHATQTNGYSFYEKPKFRIDKEKLEKLKIGNSPLIAKLKEGKDIEINGKKIKAKELVYSENGKKISFIFDTKYCENAIKLAKDSDLLIAESTYISEDEERAKEYMHMTSSQAAEIAKKADVKRLILTHISQKNSLKEDQLLKEAQKVFKKTELAKDFMEVKV